MKHRFKPGAKVKTKADYVDGEFQHEMEYFNVVKLHQVLNQSWKQFKHSCNYFLENHDGAAIIHQDWLELDET